MTFQFLFLTSWKNPSNCSTSFETGSKPVLFACIKNQIFKMLWSLEHPVGIRKPDFLVSGFRMVYMVGHSKTGQKCPVFEWHWYKWWSFWILVSVDPNHSKTGPFVNWSCLNHSKTGLVRFLMPTVVHF